MGRTALPYPPPNWQISHYLLYVQLQTEGIFSFTYIFVRYLTQHKTGTFCQSLLETTIHKLTSDPNGPLVIEIKLCLMNRWIRYVIWIVLKKTFIISNEMKGMEFWKEKWVFVRGNKLKFHKLWISVKKTAAPKFCYISVLLCFMPGCKLLFPVVGYTFICTKYINSWRLLFPLLHSICGNKNFRSFWWQN